MAKLNISITSELPSLEAGMHIWNSPSKILRIKPCRQHGGQWDCSASLPGWDRLTLFGADVGGDVRWVRPRGKVLIAVGDKRGEGVNRMRRLYHWHLV